MASGRLEDGQPPAEFREMWEQASGPASRCRAPTQKGQLFALVGREPFGDYDDPDLRWHIRVRYGEPGINGRIPTWDELVSAAHELRPGVVLRRRHPAAVVVDERAPARAAPARDARRAAGRAVPPQRDRPGADMIEHVFTSRTGQSWDRCVCGVARSAHLAEDEPYPLIDEYRCPQCVLAGAGVCCHTPEQIDAWLARRGVLVLRGGGLL